MVTFEDNYEVMSHILNVMDDVELETIIELCQVLNLPVPSFEDDMLVYD